MPLMDRAILAANWDKDLNLAIPVLLNDLENLFSRPLSPPDGP
jgi:hypothetical protein